MKLHFGDLLKILSISIYHSNLKGIVYFPFECCYRLIIGYFSRCLLHQKKFNLYLAFCQLLTITHIVKSLTLKCWITQDILIFDYH